MISMDKGLTPTTTGVEGGFIPFEQTLTFDWKTPPLHLNQRMNNHAHDRIVAETRLAGKLMAHRIPALGKCRVTLTWYVVTKTVRDEENPVPTLKALCDGLVDAGVVVDDRPAYMTKLMPEIVWLDKKLGHVAHMTLRVERIE
ncbi:hypothetical protein [Cryobacterium sp. Y11]|uniref:hypothetical protein n=1 Tax=Cryobacterium sp. Y11 TaxID=2045016 RepID=UPI000CE361F0|nr:hypothetical protein [Cryobacterium sp. Y11]